MIHGIIYLSLLAFSSVYDMKYFKVLDKVNLAICLLGILNRMPFNLAQSPDIVYSSIGGIFLLLLSAFTCCMGGGDVKFIYSNFIYLGFSLGVQAVFFACICVVIMNLGKKRARIPMVPYLSFGFGLLFLFKMGRGL